MTTARRQARAVLLLQDLWGSPWEVRAFTHLLRERSLRVFAPALRGYSPPGAGSSDDDRHADCRLWIEQASAELEAIAGTHAEVMVCGIGLGAALALAVAAAGSPSLLGISLVSTTLFFDGWDARHWTWLSPALRCSALGRWYRRRDRPPYGVRNPLSREWIAAQVAKDGEAWPGRRTIPDRCLLEAYGLARHAGRNVGRVRTPSLLIHSCNDDLVSLARIRDVRARLGLAPMGEVVVEHSGRRITLDADCELAAVKTAQFFNEVARRGADARRA